MQIFAKPLTHTCRSKSYVSDTSHFVITGLSRSVVQMLLCQQSLDFGCHNKRHTLLMC